MSVVDPYYIPGGELCTICGLTFYNPSAGGPGICPSCDCGNFGPTVVQAQGKSIAALEARCREQRETLNGYLRDKTRDIAAYQARIAELEAALRWIKGECLFACGRTDGFDLRKNLGEISHRVSLAINGSEPETSCEHHWMPATQDGSLAIIGRGCSKCGAWETSEANRSAKP